MPGVFGASTTHTPTGIQTSVRAPSASLSAPGGGMFGDMGWLSELARRRAQQAIEQQNLQNQLLGQQVDAARFAMQEARRPHLGQRAPDPYSQAMTMARAQTDANSMIQGGKIRDMMQAKSTIFDPLSTLAMRGAGSGILGAEQQYGQLPIAASLTGNQLPQATGWDRYAQIAGAGGSAAGAAAENFRATQPQSPSPMETYMNSLRMYQPQTFAQMVASQKKQ